MEVVVSREWIVMRRWGLVVVSLVLGTSLLAVPAAAGEPPVPLPSRPTGLTPSVVLPDGLDPASPYLPQASCNPVDMVGPQMLRDLVLRTYGVGGRGNISRGCTEGVSEHSEGRAWDWMVDVDKPSERAAAADFLSWVTRDDGANARRLGIMYVIYNKRIWSVYNTRGGWRKSSGHTDHVHVSFSWNGARGNTSFWTGQVGVVDFGPCARFAGSSAARTSTPRAARCPAPASALVKTSRATRAYGSTGKTVRVGQKRLGVAVTGRFDHATWRAVRAYQAAHDLPRTGVLDQPTWASLDRGSITRRTVKGFTRRTAARHGVEHYSSTTLRRGRAGKGVAILQTALGLPRADRNGYFDTVTQAAVRKAQGRAGLASDGLVSREEWTAILAGIG